MKYNVLKTAGKCALLVVFLLTSWQIQAQYQIVAETSKISTSFGQFVVIGDFHKKWHQKKELSFFQSIMPIYVKGSSVPLLGKYLLSSDSLIFTPRFSPDPTITYVVNFRVKKSTPLITSEFVFPDKSTATALLNVSPAHSLPANALRVYLNFDQPMGLQNPFDFIQLTSEDGKVIKDAFVEYKQGLWNHNRTRLTLLFHPGRIKQGVALNRILGPVFQSGKNYELVIDEGWRGQNGAPIKNEQRILWNITEDIRTKIDPDKWLITAPRYTSDSLVIIGDRIMDEEIFKRLVVVKKGEEVIQGQWKIIDKKYVFINTTSWNKGVHQIIIPTHLEDVSGNTLLSAFDLSEKMNLTTGVKKVLSFYIL